MRYDVPNQVLVKPRLRRKPDGGSHQLKPLITADVERKRALESQIRSVYDTRALWLWAEPGYGIQLAHLRSIVLRLPSVQRGSFQELETVVDRLSSSA